MVAVGLALGGLLARVITRPVRELTDAAQKIAAGITTCDEVLKAAPPIGD